MLMRRVMGKADFTDPVLNHPPPPISTPNKQLADRSRCISGISRLHRVWRAFQSPTEKDTDTQWWCHRGAWGNPSPPPKKSAFAHHERRFTNTHTILTQVVLANLKAYPRFIRRSNNYRKASSRGAYGHDPF